MSDILEPFDGVRYRRAKLYEAPEWYDVDYAGYKAEEPFYKMVATQFVKREGAYVEIGAGTGRLLLAIAREGTRAHAVEPADAMLRELEAKTARENDSVEGLVSWEHAEGESMAGPEDRPAHAIVFPFNGLLHVPGAEAFGRILARARGLLDDEGAFAVDITTPAWEEMGIGGRDWGRVDERVHPLTGEAVLTCDRCRYDERTRIMHTKYRFVVDGAEEGVELSIEQRMWTFQEVQHCVVQAGFDIEMVFGDVDFAPLVEKSPRLLLVARPRT